MDVGIRKNHKLRINAFDLLQELKNSSTSRKEIINKIHSEFGIPIGTLYHWYKNKVVPYGRKGTVLYKPELFYVIGALLGDGCLYNWRTTNYYSILIGDHSFAVKYAKILTTCTAKEATAYIDRNKNIWFVRCNNFGLYNLFEKVRKDLNYLEQLIKQGDKRSAILFIEGFFDAEGCVKVIKERVRKTPKICLDITNTNIAILNLVEKLLKEHLSIESKYSIQKSFIGKDGFKRQEAYHLRIYKKEYIKRFLKNISTSKLKAEKVPFVENWLNI